MPGMFGGGGMSLGDMSALANQEAQLNRTNTWSPIYGGTTWSQSGADQGSGPRNGTLFGPDEGSNGTPGGGGGTWTQTQVLSPFMQQRFDLARQLQSRVAGEMQPLDTSKLTDVSLDPNFEKEQQQQAYAFARSNLDPQWQQQELQLKSQLASQGVHPGDPSYTQAMNQFQSQKASAYNQASAGSYQTGVQAGATREQTRIGALQAQIQEALQKSGWSLGQINALMAGMPGAPGGQVNPISLLGPMLQQSMYNQGLQAQFGSNLIGGASLLGGAALMSDVEAKEDFSDAAPAIEEFLESAEPAEYSYRPEYQEHPLAGRGRFVSPMAQGLERSSIGRQMVVDTPEGKVVDYGRSFGAVLASLSHLNKKLNTVMGL